MDENPEPNFIHRFIPSTSGNTVTLLLLHGTGGNENDLIPLAREVSQSAAILSPRGKVVENGMARFFRRFAEGVFDIEDLKLRTHELARFVKSASRSYNFDSRSVLALGYSNGANIAASLLLLHPEVLVGAILLRPMVPFILKGSPRLENERVLILAGSEDRIIPSQQSEKLRELLSNAGAAVELRWVEGGHQLQKEDVTLAHRWFKQNYEG